MDKPQASSTPMQTRPQENEASEENMEEIITATKVVQGIAYYEEAAYAVNKAGELEKALGIERQMHTKIKSDLAGIRQEVSVLCRAAALAHDQAGESEKALDIERHLHTQTKSELSTSQQETSKLRQAAVDAFTQAGKLKKALAIEIRKHTETKSELSASQQEASTLRQAETYACAQVGEFEKALDIERQMHIQTKSELSATEQEALALSQGQSQAIKDRNMMRREMKAKQAMYDEAVEELNKAKEAAATAHQGQMKANSKLKKVMRLNQGSDQFTDTQLVQKLVELRDNIRAWSLTYFITEVENLPRLSRQEIMMIWNETRPYSVMGEDFFDKSLQDPIIRPTVVRSLLWKVLLGRIFRQYLWVVSPYSSSVKETQEFLSFNMKKRSQHSDEKSHKLNIWRADGNTMLSQAQDPDRKRLSRNLIIIKWVTSTIFLLRPLLSSQDQNDARDGLYQIIDQALALDEELCQQVADVSVQYLRDSSGLVSKRFDPRAMTTEEIGSQDATEGDVVSAVVAPALVKRGNSAGKDFDKKILLMPMEVICQPIEPSPRRAQVQSQS